MPSLQYNDVNLQATGLKFLNFFLANINQEDEEEEEFRDVCGLAFGIIAFLIILTFLIILILFYTQDIEAEKERTRRFRNNSIYNN